MKLSDSHKNAIKTASTMVAGALLLVILAFTIWATANLDVLVKTMRYPEAVRELQITVEVKQHELVSPLAE